MAKKKKSPTTDFGMGLLIPVIRFGIAWTGRLLSEFGKFLKYVFGNLPIWNRQFDNWTQVQFSRTIAMPIKIGIVGIFFYFFGIYALGILFLILILKTF